ncbi:hypothetical protein WKH57_01790 [Niallia taxi]|uniref:hypothetical protein n=1 Tax=Niallia taxi TaxID=2499688 RepID=UPI00316D2C0C
MIKVIPWQFKTLSSFDIIENIVDENAISLGTIELVTDGLAQKREKRSLLGKKEVFVRQNNIILKNNNETIKVKATCNMSITSIANKVLDRIMEYEKNGHIETFILNYHNESLKYYYDFTFKDEVYQIFFDDDGFTFEILKNKSFVAKYQQINVNEKRFEVETAYEADVWLWLTLFVHLRHNYNRNKGIIFRGLS